MILVADMAAWLKAQSWWPVDGGSPVEVYDPDRLNTHGLPDRAVFLFPSPGAGLLLEQAFDVPAFQFRIRGQQGGDGAGYADTEQMAQAIDKGLVNGWPTLIGGRAVQKIARVGGAPSYLLRDEASRSHFTGNYLFTVAY